MSAAVGPGPPTDGVVARPVAARRPRAFALVCAFAGVALCVVVVLPLVGLFGQTGVSGLRDAVQDGEVMRSLVLTLGAALVATAIALVLGIPFAYLLARQPFPGRGIVESVIDLPVVLPHTAAGIALLTVYGQEGIAGRLFAPLGIVFTDSFAGIVAAMLFVSLPFLVGATRQAFVAVDPRYEGVARTLGASPVRAFATVALPMAWRGVLGGALMMWARGISEFGAVVILAYNPKVVPVLVFERFEGFGLEAALPAAALIALVALILFTGVRFLLAWRRRGSAQERTGARWWW
jgi:molybdate/tungstate transport system permease protein